ncbi:MAG TPA: hypothetical protein V6C63_19390 [Allocoleopsis sp.]
MGFKHFVTTVLSYLRGDRDLCMFSAQLRNLNPSLSVMVLGNADLSC